MHRYEELEKLYYKKIFFKGLIFFILVLIIGLSIFYLLNYLKKDNKKNIKKETKIQVHIKENNKSKKDVNIIKKINSSNKNVKKSKSNKKLDELLFILPLNEENNTIINKNIPKNDKKNVKSKVKTNIKNLDFNKEKKILIKEKEVTLHGLIKRFNEYPEYNLAIVISKEYLKRKDLKRAKIWALRANNLSPENIDSWMIFADILLKQNKRKEAIKVLKIYIQDYGKNDKIEEKIRSINGQ